MKVHLTDTYVSADCEALELSADSKNHWYRVVIDRKTRVPRYASDSGPSRIAVNMMRIAMKYEAEALAYLDTPPYSFRERMATRCALPERNDAFNALSDKIKKEEV